MSYILDALRKADAERERGSVPGIHAQPLAAVLPQVPASRIGGFGGLPDGTARWLIGCAAAGLAVVAALVLWRGTAPDPAVAVSAPLASVERAGPAATEPTPATLTAQQPAAPAPAAPPAVAAEAPAVGAVPPTVAAEVPAVARVPPSPVAAAPSRRPEPAALPARGTVGTTGATRPPATAPAPTPTAAAATPPGTSSAKAATRVPSTAVTATTTSASAAPTAAADPAPQSTADNRIYQLRDLPDDIRRELPALTVGGATYSENAASRMLIVNGQVFHENDKLAPELVLERIQLRSAVLRYKGLRYAIAY